MKFRLILAVLVCFLSCNRNEGTKQEYRQIQEVFQKHQLQLEEIVTEMRTQKVCRISRIKGVNPYFEDNSKKYQKILKKMSALSIFLITDVATFFDDPCKLYFHFDNWNTIYSGSYGVVFSQKNDFEYVFESAIDFETKSHSSINLQFAAKNWHYFKQFPHIR